MNLDDLIDTAPEFPVVADPATCNHSNTEFRQQRHGAIVKQCQDCGRNCSNAISKQSLTNEQRQSIMPFDYSLEAQGWARREEERKLEKVYGCGHKLRQNEMTQREEYQAYLRSPQWAENRRLVIDRESGVCQGCRSEKIQEVHHATYENAGNEFLFQLVGLCWSCHRRAHPEKQ